MLEPVSREHGSGLPADAAAVTEDEQRDAVDRIARSWVGTPYHPRGEVKGVGADCATLIKCVFEEAGLIPKVKLPPYSHQFFMHASQERYLFLVAGHARELTPEVASDDPAVVVPPRELQHGDVVLYKIGRCYGHGGIVLKPGWPHIVHAHYRSQVVREGNAARPCLGLPVHGVKFFTKW